MGTAWQAALQRTLEDRSTSGLLRVRRTVSRLGGTRVEVDGRPLVNFASNDYLGLSDHARVRAAMAGRPAGSGASALVTGRSLEQAAAEARLARWKGAASAVLLSSGYAANVAVIQAVVAAAGSGRVRLLVDKLAHASLLDAVRAAAAGPRVSFRVYPHNGTGKLRRLLTAAAPDELQVVVTESIFSMDGDAADLVALVELKEQFGFLLVLDEAHAAGVYGTGGAGLAAEIGLASSVDLSVVTLSKAVGVIGGAVCGSADWVEAVVNFGRPYVYSTSPPPGVAAAVVAALDVMADEPERQARVRRLARDVRGALTAAGLTLPPGDSPILPIVLGGEADAVAAADRLAAAGFLVAAIRPPTVPRGTSRLRVTLSSEHSDAEVAGAVAGIVNAVGELATDSASLAARPEPPTPPE